MKKIVKIILIFFSIFMLIFSLNCDMYLVYGASIDEIFLGGNEFIKKGEEKENNKVKEDKLKDVSSTIYSALFNLAIIVAVAVGGILGIQYMTAGPEKKADLNKGLMGYIICCMVLFGAVEIWKIILNFGSAIQE